MQSFAVIGLGRFGKRLAQLLAEGGAQVIAIDRQKELIEAIRNDVDRAVCLDSTDIEALRAQGIDKVDVAVVGIGAAFEADALTTAVLKQIGVPRVISRATTTIRGQVLERIGADDTVNPERESAERWAKQLLAPSIMEHIALAEGYSLAQIAAPKSFYNKSLKELAVLTKYEVNVIAIRRSEQPAEGVQDAKPTKPPRQFVISVPMADTVIVPQDVLLLIGSDEAIADFPTD